MAKVRVYAGQNLYEADSVELNKELKNIPYIEIENPEHSESYSKTRCKKVLIPKSMAIIEYFEE
ncbi:MAG TPA: hypothetical protein VMW81_06095 [Nitrospinota bacterium]|nr:hypothetical protein [Nitrospinota bacterium]